MKEKTLPVVEFFNRVLLRRDHEDLSPLSSISSQIDRFIKWKHANRRTGLLHEARYLLLGLVSLAAVTGLYFWLDAPLVSAAFTYLVVLVLLSLVSSFSSLIVLSFVGVGCLSYFFAPPIYSFRVNLPQNVITITAFVITSLIVNFLVTKVRAEQRNQMLAQETLRDATQKLDATNNALRNENAEHSRAEEALRESEAKFRDYAETASDWLWEIGPDYKFTQLTENAFGSDSAHRIGTACWDHALDLETEPEKWLLIQATLDSRKPFRDFVYCSVGGDGAPMYVKASGKPVFDTHGEFRGYRGTGTDVTAIARVQRAEASLQMNETERLRVQSRLANIISSSSDAIIGKTLDGIVLSWNAAAESIFGYEAQEMIGQSITRIIPPELQEEENTILARLRQGDRFKNYETVRTRKDGSRIDISLTVSPVLDPSGKVVGASKIARDITAEKRAEAELQLVQEELARAARIATLGELTAVIAHEVNQPLTGVVNSGNACLRWLSSETPNLTAARASVERIINAGNRAAEVIKRIRALIEKAPPKRERLNINGAIREVLALVEGEIQRKSISLHTDLASDAPLIFGDRIQLQQVILNLILNAIEAMSVTLPPRELLVISAKNETNDVLVTVRDSGTGLDEKSVDRLFEAFYTTKAQGMGIGLAVSRTIVQTHGGVLWARPNTPRGAAFMFTLPADGEHVS